MWGSVSRVLSVGKLAGLLPSALTRAMVGAKLYPQTAAELAAAVTPSDYAYPPGDVRRYGATGDGVTDDAAAFVSAIAVGGRITGARADSYRVASGIVLAKDDTLIDLGGASIVVDFAAGVGVTIGDGVTVYQRCGIKNTRVRTTQVGTGLHGVKFTTNVRHGVQPEGLLVEGFKGTGLEFQQLNWNVQSIHGLYVRDCGVNLKVGQNGNALTFVDCTLLDATTYNADLDGATSVNFVGGIIQGAGTAGVRLDDAAAACYGVTFWGTYFEDNGASHLVADGANGVTVAACYLQCNGMTADALVFTNCDGVTILPNTPVNVSPNNLLNLDASCSRVQVWPQSVTTATDETITGTLDALAGNALQVADTAALATPAVLQNGALRIRRVSDRDIPYVALRVSAAGDRRWEPMGFGPRKVAAAAAANPQNLSLLSGNVHDYTLGAASQFTAPSTAVVDGELLTVMLKQNSVGGHAVTWAAGFKTDLTASGTADQYASVTFRYSASRALWLQVGKMEWKS